MVVKSSSGSQTVLNHWEAVRWSFVSLLQLHSLLQDHFLICFFLIYFISRLTISNYLHGKEISKCKWLFNVSGINLGSSSGWRLKTDTFR